MMRRILLLMLGFVFLGTQLWAQRNRTITGKITDENGSGIANASVVVKESPRIGATTNSQGVFTLNVPANGRTLIVSSTGLGEKEVNLTATGVYNISLSVKSSDMQELMVVAYGRQTRKSFTGSAATLNNDLIAHSPRPSLQDNLQGNVPGVQAVNGSGQPGGVPNIRIRGIGSINAGSAPLYVVDGIPVVSGDITGYNSNTIAGLNGNDIESVTILKDAAAASLYGSRAANGVVLITTKKGNAGKTKISASAQFGINKLTLRGNDLPLNTNEMIELLREGWINSGRTAAAFNAELVNRAIDTTINTDWVGALTRTGKYRQYDVSASGGNDRTTFYLSGGLQQQEAALNAVDYKRLTSKLALTNKVSDRLNFNSSLNLSYQRSNTVSSAGAFANPVRTFYRLQPWIPIYNPDGSYNFNFNSTFNPVALAEKNFRRANTYSALGSVGGVLNIVNGLTYESKAGLDLNYGEGRLFSSPGFGDGRNYNGYGSNFNTLYVNWITTNLLRYRTTFATDHSIEVLAGYEAQKTKTTSSQADASNFLANTTTLANASKQETATSSETVNALSSWLSNLSYNFKKRYYLTGSFRRDGSSRFGANKRFGNFWSVGAAWDVAGEKFMTNVAAVSSLKLRASYGTNGNQDIGNFDSRALYGVNGYENNPGYVFTQFGNPDLTWEVNKPLNLGLDFSMFRGRLNATVEYYTRTTSDLILSVPISSTNGVTSYTANFAEMKNKGWEFSISSRNVVSGKPGGFSWETSFNLTTQENRITKLLSPIRTAPYNREVGLDFYQYYLIGYAGVDAQTGEAMWYADSSKKTTTKNYGAGIRFNSGSALPKMFGGLTNTFSFKGLTLSFQLFGNFGNKVYDGWGSFTNSDGSSGFSATGKINRYTYDHRWRQAGQETDVPKVVYLGSQTGLSNQTSSRFLYDGTYVRLRDITLAYSLPQSVIGRIKMSNARLYVRASNLATWVKDKRLAFDPEVPVTGDLDQRPPIYKTILFGLDISL